MSTSKKPKPGAASPGPISIDAPPTPPTPTITDEPSPAIETPGGTPEPAAEAAPEPIPQPISSAEPVAAADPATEAGPDGTSAISAARGVLAELAVKIRAAQSVARDAGAAEAELQARVRTLQGEIASMRYKAQTATALVQSLREDVRLAYVELARVRADLEAQGATLEPEDPATLPVNPADLGVKL